MPFLEYDNPVIDEVIAVTRSLSELQIMRLIKTLSEGELLLSAGVLQVKQVLHSSTAEARNIASLLRHWQNEKGSVETLTTALLVARAAYVHALTNVPSIQLVWTGPINASSPTRSTTGVLLDLIGKAQQEIIIVGYALTEAAMIVFERLADAQRRGVQVTLIGDRLEEKLSVLKFCWPVNQQLPLLYTRAETPDDPQSALHAKLAIADQRYMLVTSANLTYHGLAGNIEIGVEIEGQVAADATVLLNRLITEGVCIQIASNP